MNRRLKGLLLVVLAGGAISCAGSKGLANDTGIGGTGGGAAIPIPLRPCSSDAQCTGGTACVASQCIAKLTTVGDLAIEIDPPSTSGSQITELPSVGTVMPVLTADPELSLTITFDIQPSGTGPSTTVPTNAGAIVTVPSRIAGRPALSFQANLAGTTATLKLPESIRGAQATVTLIPTSQSEQTSPPYRMTAVIPTMGGELKVALPAEGLLLSGKLVDAIGDAKSTYTARAFQQGLLVSSSGTTGANANTPGGFVVSLPGGTSADIALELVPSSSSVDPWVTFNQPLTLTKANTDLGTITLPSYLSWNLYRLAAYGNDPARTLVADAGVRAYTTLNGEDKRISAKFFRDGTTDDKGGTNLQLIPGDTRNPRTYAISVVPPATSTWASQCIETVPVAYTGQTQTVSPLPDVVLVPRPVIRGVVMSATAAPVANLIVKATRTAAPAPPCLPGPSTTSVSTNAAGAFDLPVDPGTYQLDYIPAPGSAIPRLTATETVTVDLFRAVVMPAPAPIEGDLQSATNTPLPMTTIRFFAPQCPTTAGCSKPPLLRAETQSDANGHFRAVIAAPAGTY